MHGPTLAPELAYFSATDKTMPVPHLGTRYSEQGVFLPEPGNTVVCHLAESSETERALLDARRRCMELPQANLLAFTAASSLHMTLFQGIIDTRRTRPYWPADVPLDTPVAEMTEIFRDRLETFEPSEPFRVQATLATPCGLIVEAATDKDRLILGDWRDRLADVFGYRHPDHETYEFHITFAYVLRWLDDATLLAWQPVFRDIVADIRRRAPLLELRAPAFSSFEDMNHFEELEVFEPSPDLS